MKKNKSSLSRILFFTEFFAPVQNSTAYYITKICCTAAKVFDQVHVFCAASTDSRAEQSMPENLIVHRIDSGSGDKNKIISRILKFCRISIKFTWALFRNARSTDTIFAVTNPAFMIPIMAMVKKFIGFKYILLAYDIFPENLFAADLLHRKNLAYKVTKKFFDWGYRSADSVISIGRDMSEILKQKGVPANKIILIPNWADDQSIKQLPKNGNRLVKQYRLEDKRIFLFAGNFGRVQGIPELLDVIDHVSSPDVAFLFVGDGKMRGTIEDYLRKHPDKNVFCHPYLPMSEQNTFLNACDIAIVTLGKNMLGLGVPSKSYYSLASGHPIFYIGEQDSEISYVLQEWKCGWQISPGNIAECAKTIDRIAALPQAELDLMSQNAKECLSKHYSEKMILDRYIKYFGTWSTDHENSDPRR